MTTSDVLVKYCKSHDEAGRVTTIDVSVKYCTVIKSREKARRVTTSDMCA